MSPRVWRGWRWGVLESLLIALATATVFAAFLWHVAQGGAHAPRTLAAMAVRLGVWTTITAVAWRGRR